ncbi:MAG: type II/IV secretion system protein [Desulfobacteraceae bacterium]|nr:type II/IV secretion system protein [Desulfobacteraceae bacterium]
MNRPATNLLSTENVLQALLENNIITRTRAENILKKEDGFKQKLEAARAKKNEDTSQADKIENPVTIIDILSSLKLTRSDTKKTLDEDAIYQALAGKWNIPYIKIDPLKLDLNIVTTTIPRSFAKRHLVLPIDVADGVLTVATPDPSNNEVMDDISRASNLKIKTVVSSKTDIIRLINEFFGFKRSIAAAENQFSGPTVDLGNLEQYVRLSSGDELPSNDQHVVNAVNHLFIYAFDQKSSDIHIEPKRDVSLVRLRIDGVLHTVYKLPKNVHSAIISRIKNLSRLDMAEKRRPQDGRIKTDKGGVEVEIRVSSIPVAFGEKIVMRIMDPDILFQDLHTLGLTDADLKRFNQFVSLPHGIVLVTGPTGSGKSTTLYSTLRNLASPAVNITTIEDPIEMIHEDFNQIAVQPQVDITFGSVLRYILRQDPDIIMIGEMRDLETAENAIQAALTGHLVLSTLHTNDAPATVIRLLELGVPSFLLQATLNGIVAQRLVRKICAECKTPFEINVESLKKMGIDVGTSGKIKVYKGKGCQKCRGTGYRGRIGIFEVLPYNDSMRKLTITGTDLERLKRAAREEGMTTLRESAVDKFLKGITTFDEVLRVTWEQF